MHIDLESGMFPSSFAEAAREGNIPRYVVVGVDVVHLDGADPKSKVGVDSRHFRLIDILEPGLYLPCSAEELRRELQQRNIRSANLLREPVVESDDHDTQYTLTPLQPAELEILCKR